MKEMRNRVRRITQDLNTLLQELAAVREPQARELVEGVLTPEVIKAFKSSVDAMRRLLWVYIEASACAAGQSQNQTLRGVVDALRSMRETAPSTTRRSGDGSFIEKMEAIVEKKMPGGRSN
jgi:hypothetical protein